MDQDWQDDAAHNGVSDTAIIRRGRLLERVHAVVQEMVVAVDEHSRWLEALLQYDDDRAREIQSGTDMERVFDARRDWERMVRDTLRELRPDQGASEVL